MSDTVGNTTIEILRSIQASITEFRAEASVQFESLIRVDFPNPVGTLAIMRATAGDFELRINDLEKRVAALEASV